MPAPDATLATLVAARLCHDLISPVGAIGNGLELMRLTQEPGEEMALIGDSVAHAEARLKLYRIAFGNTTPGQEISGEALMAILSALSGSRRAALDWQIAGPVPRDEAQMGLLALMCLESALPWGGTLCVTRSAGTWQLTGTADRLRIDPAAWEALQAPQKTVGAAQVEFALLAALAQASGRKIMQCQSDTDICLAF